MKGQLQAADTSDPIPYGKVQFHDGDPVYADDKGRFTIIVSNGLERVVLTASDVFGDYVQTTKIIHPNVMSGVTKTLITMLRKAVGVSFNASEDTVLTMGSDKEDEVFAGMHIPPQSVFSDDGSVYTGDVKASLKVIDPRNMTDVITAPSDLTFVDEEGEVQPLKTFGMFNLELTDPSGNPLQTEGDVDLMLDPELLGYSAEDFGDNLPKLWVLDSSSGEWVKLADMQKEQGSSRFKRQTGESTVLVGNVNVSISGKWINYDIKDTSEVCLSNLRLYATDAFTEEISGAEPYVLIQDGNTYQGYYRNRGSDTGGYCIAHPCDVNSRTGYHGYVYIEYDGNQTFHVNENAGSDVQGIKDDYLKRQINYKDEGNAISVNFSYRNQQSTRGPFYLATNWWRASDCTAADASANHFRFYVEEAKTQNSMCEPAEYTKVNIERDESINDIDDPDSNGDYYWYAWYTKKLYPDYLIGGKSHTVVYIKVKTNSSSEIALQAESMVGNEISGSPGQVGYRIGCADDSKPVCLEVKPSGPVAGSLGSLTDDSQYCDTQVVIKPMQGKGGERCSGYRILNTDLLDLIGVSTQSVDSRKFEVKLTKTVEERHSHSMGLYWYKGNPTDTLADVRDKAKAICEEGVNPLTGKATSDQLTIDNCALEFICE